MDAAARHAARSTTWAGTSKAPRRSHAAYIVEYHWSVGHNEEGPMRNAPLAGVQACVFDASGTLFDFASAARGCRDVLGDAIEKLSALWRDKQLQYTWLRAVQGRHADFWQVTGDALDFALETLAIEKPGLRDRLMNLYLTLEPFPEVPEVLRRLKAVGFANRNPVERLTPDARGGGRSIGLEHGHRRGALGGSPRHLQAAPQSLPTRRRPARDPGCCNDLQSSNAWDAYAASAFGMQVVWCNRYGQRPERLPGKPDRIIRSLAELPVLVGASQA
jgi:2-haloacid dehalogenase